jgi:hypothetical protein
MPSPRQYATRAGSSWRRRAKSTVCPFGPPRSPGAQQRSAARRSKRELIESDRSESSEKRCRSQGTGSHRFGWRRCSVLCGEVYLALASIHATPLRKASLQSIVHAGRSHALDVRTALFAPNVQFCRLPVMSTPYVQKEGICQFARTPRTHSGRTQISCFHRTIRRRSGQFDT